MFALRKIKNNPESNTKTKNVSENIIKSKYKNTSECKTQSKYKYRKQTESKLKQKYENLFKDGKIASDVKKPVSDVISGFRKYNPNLQFSFHGTV